MRAALLIRNRPDLILNRPDACRRYRHIDALFGNNAINRDREALDPT